MSHRVVCVSRALGAGGEEVAHLVSDALGFRFVDDEIIIRAADRAGVPPATITEAEHTPSLLARILEALATVPMGAEGGAGIMPPVYPVLTYTDLIERVIREVANEGDVIIVAHGASIPLASSPSVLRVLVTASPGVRAERMSAAQGIDLRAATKAIEASDRERHQFLRRFYDVGHELPTHYDMTVNTDALTVAAAAHLVVQAAQG